MGAGASVPAVLDEAQAKKLAGNNWCQEAFDEMKDFEGKITKGAFDELLWANVSTPRATIPLPTELEDVGVEFLALALKDSGLIRQETQIVSFQKVACGGAIENFRYKQCVVKDIMYEPSMPDEAPRSAIVRLYQPAGQNHNNADEISSKLENKMLACWHAEVDCITRKLKEPSSDFAAPQIYFAQWRYGKPPKCVVIMEHAESKEPYDILTGIPVERACRAAHALASLHAPYWGWNSARYRATSAFARYEDFSELFAGDTLTFAFLGLSAAAEMFVENFGTDEQPYVAQLLDCTGIANFCRFFNGEIWPLLEKYGLDAVKARWNRIPHGLTHNDLHAENMIYLADGSNAYKNFCPALAPAIGDVSWLVASSLEPGELCEHEETIVRSYHTALLSRLESLGGVAHEYTWEQCWEDFVFMKFRGLIFCAINVAAFLVLDADSVTEFCAQRGIDTNSFTAIIARYDAICSRVTADLQRNRWAALLGDLSDSKKGDDGESAEAEAPGPLATDGFQDPLMGKLVLFISGAKFQVSSNHLLQRVSG